MGTPRSLLILAAAGAALAAAWVAATRGAAPAGTWFYPLVWYPTLVLLDAATTLRVGRGRRGSYYWLDRPWFALSLFAWSAVGWFLFELLNFRIENWYYVFVPRDRAERWIGIVLSFATVFPALFLAERALRALGLGERWRIRPLPVTSRGLRWCRALGLVFVALSMAWPRVFYPLVWGAVTLLLEPHNYRRDPARSLLGDLARGDAGRILRLIIGGLGIGFLWEAYNVPATAKWIYTVPGLEDWKLFEMPLPGFLGFPVFALDAFVLYQALVLRGVALPPERETRLRVARSAARTARAGILGGAFAVMTLVGMETFTITSYAPREEDLAALPPDAAGLAVLRGIGTENAAALRDAGVRSVTELAAADPDSLYAQLVRLRGRNPGRLRPAQVRVWVRAAQRASSP